MAYEQNKNNFEKRVKPLLQYVGTIGALLMVVAYIVCVIILVEGFKASTLKNNILFAFVNAGIGLIITQLLKVQGISFAENIPENKAILKEYYSLKTKDKKLHSIKFYWTISLIKDICFKGFSIMLSSIGIIYIVIEGCKDSMLFLLASVNLIMFICFGILALNSAYEFYNNRHIPFIKERINEIKETNNDKLYL